jgi:hypothetical protein
MAKMKLIQSTFIAVFIGSYLSNPVFSNERKFPAVKNTLLFAMMLDSTNDYDRKYFYCYQDIFYFNDIYSDNCIYTLDKFNTRLKGIAFEDSSTKHIEGDDHETVLSILGNLINIRSKKK